MKKLNTEASIERLGEVTAFLDSSLDGLDMKAGDTTQLEVAVEEIFTNICNYAYGGKTGVVCIGIEAKQNPRSISITFTDSGTPYNPLEKSDPDITLSADEREIGGLGIFMVKQIMDEILYDYKDGQNILTLKKFL